MRYELQDGHDSRRFLPGENYRLKRETREYLGRLRARLARDDNAFWYWLHWRKGMPHVELFAS